VLATRLAPKSKPVALLIANGCDERGAGEKFILCVASLLDYSDRLLGISHVSIACALVDRYETRLKFSAMSFRLLHNAMPDFVLTLQFINLEQDANDRVFRNVLRFCRSKLSAYMGAGIDSAVRLGGLPLTSIRRYRLH